MLNIWENHINTHAQFQSMQSVITTIFSVIRLSVPIKKLSSYINCALKWYNGDLTLHQKQKPEIMNTTNISIPFDNIISSMPSLAILAEMVADMDLELVSVSAEQ